MTDLKILFMGTPDFARDSLSALLDAGANVVGVVTQPDKAKNRGMKVTFCEVKQYALEKGLTVYQPESLKNGELQELLDELSPDIIAVVAYGKILPQYVLDFPEYGCINVHGSLLPEYRGAAPIQRAVIDGKTVTGVTTMYMDKGLDTGDMIFAEKTEIGENETVGEVWDRLARIGGRLLVKTVEAIAEGTAPRIPQDSLLATHAAKIEKEEAKVDFSLPAKAVHDKIRGMTPYPAAYAFLDGIPTKVYDTEVRESKNEKTPGGIEEITPDGVLVACGKDAVFIRSLKLEGSKKLSVKDLANGRKISKDSIFS